jgi:endonuclease YncB( thermonuclease family)
MNKAAQWIVDAVENGGATLVDIDKRMTYGRLLADVVRLRDGKLFSEYMLTVDGVVDCEGARVKRTF